MHCKINNIAHINRIKRLYTRRKYNYYSYHVRLHILTHTPYQRLPPTNIHTSSFSHIDTRARVHTHAHARVHAHH